MVSQPLFAAFLALIASVAALYHRTSPTKSSVATLGERVHSILLVNLSVPALYTLFHMFSRKRTATLRRRLRDVAWIDIRMLY